MALFDAFLKLDGIKGESPDSQHKDEIDVLSFSWGEEQTASSPTGGGSGAGKVKFHDFSITKKTDASSPLLMLHCANGAHIKEANFVVRKAGGAKLEYLKIKLTDVLISSYKPHGSQTSDVDTATTGGARASGELPSEQVTLSFAKVEVSYQPQGPDGKAKGGPIVAGWDVKANKKV